MEGLCFQYHMSNYIAFNAFMGGFGINTGPTYATYPLQIVEAVIAATGYPRYALVGFTAPTLVNPTNQLYEQRHPDLVDFCESGEVNSFEQSLYATSNHKREYKGIQFKAPFFSPYAPDNKQYAIVDANDDVVLILPDSAFHSFNNTSSFNYTNTFAQLLVGSVFLYGSDGRADTYDASASYNIQSKYLFDKLKHIFLGESLPVFGGVNFYHYGVPPTLIGSLSPSWSLVTNPGGNWSSYANLVLSNLLNINSLGLSNPFLMPHMAYLSYGGIDILGVALKPTSFGSLTFELGTPAHNTSLGIR